MWIPNLLTYLGFRRLLLINTILIGCSILIFATVGIGTSPWVIVAQACAFGFFSSVQYTSMNTLGYADVGTRDTSMASTILSTVQQLSLSFGVATASLVTAFFIPAQIRSNPSELIYGMHRAFIVLGILTILSALGFSELKEEDGESVSQHKHIGHV
jgi:MFS family permease